MNDIWSPNEIALPLTLMSVAPFLGPVAGPIVSGFVSEFGGPESWRWLNALIPFFGLLILAIAFFVRPSTLPRTMRASYFPLFSLASFKVATRRN